MGKKISFKAHPKLVKLECMDCGAELVQESRKSAYCKFCGQRYLVGDSYELYIEGDETPRQSTTSEQTILSTSILKKIIKFYGIYFAIMLVIGIIAVVVNIVRTSDSSRSMEVFQKEKSGKDKQGTNDFIRPEGFQSEMMQQVVEEMFGKPADEVTKEELDTIQYFALDTTWPDGAYVITYSTRDYRDFETRYDEVITEELEDAPFAYSKAFQEEMLEIYPTAGRADEEFFSDIHMFGNLKAIKVNNPNYMDFSCFPKLTMVECMRSSINELIKANIPVEQIEVLKIAREGVAGIDKFVALKELCVEGIETAEFAEIAKCTSLEKLYCLTVFGGTGFGALKSLTNLETLYISGSSDSVKNLDVISSFGKLENLTIVNTDLLSLDFVKNLTGLKTLRLAKNSELRDLKALRGLTQLEFLEADMNYLHGEQPDLSMVGKLKNLKGLAVDTVYGLDFLHELPQLEHLEIRLTFYDDLLEPICKMKNLKTLYLSQCSTHLDEGYEVLKELPKLEKLMVEKMEFEEEGNGIFQLDQLEELRIVSCDFLYMPPEIAVSDKLKVVDLTGISFYTDIWHSVPYLDKEECAAIQNVLNTYSKAPNLEEFYLDYYDNYIEYYDIQNLDFLSNMKNLKVLSMRSCDLTQIPEEAFKECSNLNTLILERNQISNINFVKYLPQLKCINLFDCYVADISPLLDCPILKYVDVRNNPIDENPLQGVRVISGESRY